MSILSNDLARGLHVPFLRETEFRRFIEWELDVPIGKILPAHETIETHLQPKIVPMERTR